MYGKATQTAIAAMSRLAEVYDGGDTRLSAADIAESRGLQRPFVSKLLSVLATAGLVHGTRGPGGGFSLARHPREITLYDVFSLFEREDDSLACPFGGGVCGKGDPCPLHDRLVGVQKSMDRLLHDTTFDVFRKAHRARGGGATRGVGATRGGKKTADRRSGSKKSGKSKRGPESFRATLRRPG